MSAEGPDPSGHYGHGRSIVDRDTGNSAKVIGGVLQVGGGSIVGGNVIVTDPGGVNQQAVTAAGEAKVTLGAAVVTTDPDTTGLLFARINATANGVNTVVAATGGKKIRVIGYAFTVSAACTVTIQDDSGSPVVLAGAFDIAATGGMVYVGGKATPAFETTVSQALIFNLSATVNCRGHLCYILV